MYKKFLLIVGLILLGGIVTGCNTTTPITSESTGFWDQFFVYPFSLIIKFLASFLHENYGLSIIIVTIIIRLLLLPLNIKQSKNQINNQQKMSDIKPEMKALREKYADKEDKVAQMKLQQEMVQLYQKHGINPLRIGCLPMLIQMPILMAFYFAIRRTEEIATHNFLWFSLGSPDPMFILPLIAAITTYVQFKVSSTEIEVSNSQMKLIGYVMPIIIFITASNLPAALPLYWVVGNIFVTIQTYYLHKAKKSW